MPAGVLFYLLCTVCPTNWLDLPARKLVESLSMAMFYQSHRGKISAVIVLLCFQAFACTPSQYAKDADKDAYRVVAGARKTVLGTKTSFDVNYHPYTTDAKDALIHVGEKTINFGDGPATILSVDEALEIATANNRTYQTKRETLYTAALELANSRRGWDWPMLGGDATGEASVTRGADVGQVNVGAAAVSPTLTQKLRQGGLLTLGYSLDMATNFTGWKNSSLGSLMSADFTQPLLKGGWGDFAYEPQYRAERDFIFAIYEYERYTQTFAADIFKQYLDVVQRQDQLENEQANIKRLRETFNLTKVQVAGGQVSRIQQDQAEQDLLSAEVRFQQNQQAYRDALDAYKLSMGLPIRANVELDYPGALDALSQEGPKSIPLDETAAIEVALQTRPDVLSQSAKVRDSQRDIEIAANNLLPQLDLVLGVAVPGTPDRKFAKSRFSDATRTAGVNFDYSLDQTNNRDNYRLAQIALDKAQIDLAEFLDSVRLEVRRSYRAMAQSKTSYEIQVRSVAIAVRRRKLAALQQREGQASARDVLEAEEALRNAQDGLTSALVSYTTTRLQFLATLGMLWVDDKGLIHERTEPFKFDPIRRLYPYVGA
jgi:outer membrane protein TolC